MKRTKKTASVANKTPSRTKRVGRSAGVRETEEARALLENTLHGLYWWVFNACRIKGFIRAKQGDELATAEDDIKNSGDDSPNNAGATSDEQPR